MRFSGYVFAVAYLLMCSRADAVTAIAVKEIDSVAALHAYTPGTFSSTSPATVQIHLASYYCNGTPPCQPDGGEGLLTWVSGTCNASGGEDGGSVFYDGSNNCWRRQNLNGDLRQWGLTQNSDYDAIYALDNGHTLQNATDLIKAAFDALGEQGKGVTLHTMQVNLKIDLSDKSGDPLTIPAGAALTCDAPPVKRAPKADYTHVRGSLIIAHNGPPNQINYIDASTDTNDVEIHDCAAILPEWYIDPAKAADFGGYSFNRADDPQFGYADLEKIRANMILAGDFAIKAGEGAKIHDLTIAGFDNCLYLTNAPGFLGRNVSMDCSIGAYLASTNGEMTLKDYDANPYLTKMPGFDNEEYWTVSGVTRDTITGECKLSLNAVKGQDNGMGGNKPLYSVSDLTESGLNSALGLRADPNYFPAWVTGFKDTTGQPFAMSCLSSGTGKFGNDAAWGVHIISKNPDANNYLNDSATVELMGSKYTSAQATGISVDTTGDWSANTGIIRVTGSISNLTPGMVVTSSDASWPSQQVTVLGIVQRCTGPDEGLVNTNDGYNGCVAVSPAPAAANSGSSPALRFFSVTDPPGRIGIPCNGTGQTPCFFYNAAERYVSGNSPAGQGIARLPTSRGGHFGAGFLVGGVAAVAAELSLSARHYYAVAASPADRCKFLQWGSEDGGAQFNMRCPFVPEREAKDPLETESLLWAVRCKLPRQFRGNGPDDEG